MAQPFKRREPIPESKAVRVQRKANTLRMRQLIADVRARTAAGQAKIDALAKGADMRGLRHLPVIFYPLGKPDKKKFVSKKGNRNNLGGSQPTPATEDFLERMAVEKKADERPPKKSPPAKKERLVRFTVRAVKTKTPRIYTCSACGENGHRAGGKNCRRTAAVTKESSRLAA